MTAHDPFLSALDHLMRASEVARQFYIDREKENLDWLRQTNERLSHYLRAKNEPCPYSQEEMQKLNDEYQKDKDDERNGDWTR